MGFKNGKLIRQARIDAGLSIRQLAEMMKVSYNTITNWEGNCARPNVDYTRELCEYLKVSADYLLGGEGDREADDGLDVDERWLINSYRSFGRAGRRFVERAAQAEIERTSEIGRFAGNVASMANYSHERPRRRTITLKEYAQAASAGFGDYLTDDDSYEAVELYDTDKTRRADMIIRVDGDSMRPDYSDGDRLLVMESDSIARGKVGVFVVNGDGYVKVFGGDRLISLNKRYKDVVFSENDEIKCVGLVIGKVDESMTPNRFM